MRPCQPGKCGLCLSRGTTAGAPPKDVLWECLRGMRGSCHGRFLGEKGAARLSPHSVHGNMVENNASIERMDQRRHAYVTWIADRFGALEPEMAASSRCSLPERAVLGING